MAVITNGTAVLGLGNIGPLAGKPVMEGKGCLFKKFAGIDVFDIELDERDPDKLIDTIARMEPTFGGINLEDIKAPECFYIEKKLRERMKIPVFHDDQHGTAIVAAAAILNGLQARRQGHRRSQAGRLGRGRGGAGLPGPDRQPGPADARTSSSPTARAWSTRAARRRWTPTRRVTRRTPTRARWPTSSPGADIFLGLSAGGVLKPEMVKTMAREPLILAHGQPDAGDPAGGRAGGAPRRDHRHRAARTTRTRSTTSCAFRSSSAARWTVGATTINEEMKLAAVRAIAELAHAEIPEVVAQAYGDVGLSLRPRLPHSQALRSAPDRGGRAGCRARRRWTAASRTRPIADMEAYRQRLSHFVYQSGSAMQPVFAAAKQPPSASSSAEGEDERVLRAAQVVVDEGLARPLLLGPARGDRRSASPQFGLRLKPGATAHS